MTSFHPLEAVGKGAELRRSPPKVLFHARKRSRIAKARSFSESTPGTFETFGTPQRGPSSRSSRCSAEVVP